MRIWPPVIFCTTPLTRKHRAVTAPWMGKMTLFTLSKPWRPKMEVGREGVKLAEPPMPMAIMNRDT